MDIAAYCLGGCCALQCLSWKSLTKPFICRKLTKIAEQKAPPLLGDCKVKVEGIDFSIGSQFYSKVTEMTVYNPEGFQTEFLINIDHISVTINLTAAVTSFIKAGFKKPKEVEVLILDLSGCHVIYEKHLMTSNLDTLQKRIAENDKNKASRIDTNKDGVVDRNEAKAAGFTDQEFKEADKNGDGVIDINEIIAVQDRAADVKNFTSETTNQAAQKAANAKDGVKARAEKTAALVKRDDKPKEMQLILRKVDLKDIQADVNVKGSAPIKVDIKPIAYEDFEKEQGKASIGKLVEVLVESLLRSIVADTGRLGLTAVGEAAAGAGALVESAEEQASSCSVC